MQKLEYTGVWWIPKYPEEKVCGTLEFDPIKGVDLSLIDGNFLGQMFDNIGFTSNDVFTLDVPLATNKLAFDIILGHTSDGKDVTLYRCRDKSLLGVGFSSEAVFVGHHFESISDVIFNSITINYSSLERWLGLSGFSGGHSWPPDFQALKVNINYETPLDVEAKVGALKIILGSRLESLPVAIDYSVSMKETAFIQIEPLSPLQYEQYLNTTVYYLRNFISLGLNMPIVPNSIYGEIADSNKGEGTETPFKSKTVSIYYVSKGASVVEQANRREENLFFYKQIQGEFERALTCWFEKAELLLGIQDLYFGLFYIPRMYLELEFLTLAQAIEGYHRIRHGGTFMPKQDYGEVAEAIIEAFPSNLTDEHRTSLQSRIEFGNEFTLKMRVRHILTEVLRIHKGSVDRIFGDYEDFIGQFVRFRNRLTHPTKNNSRLNDTEIRQLMSLVEKSHLLMQLCFMAEMEFSAQVVEAIFDER